MRHAAVALAVVLTVGACESETARETRTESNEKKPSDTATVKCTPLNPLTLDAISDGLTKEAAITSGEAVKLTKPEMNLQYIAALRIEDSTTQIGMLAMGGIKPGDSPWVAADNVAQMYLDWGEMAKDGTPIKDAADNAWQSSEGNAARDCLDRR